MKRNVNVNFGVKVGLDAALKRALTAGARAEGAIRTETWGKIVVLADPFGHGLCLIQFLGRGYDEIAERINGAVLGFAEIKRNRNEP